MTVPQDIKPNWLNLARRCQALPLAREGFAVVQIKVLVGPGNEPVMWFEPEIQKVEPMQNGAKFVRQCLVQMLER